MRSLSSTSTIFLLPSGRLEGGLLNRFLRPNLHQNRRHQSNFLLRSRTLFSSATTPAVVVEQSKIDQSKPAATLVASKQPYYNRNVLNRRLRDLLNPSLSPQTFNNTHQQTSRNIHLNRNDRKSEASETNANKEGPGLGSSEQQRSSVSEDSTAATESAKAEESMKEEGASSLYENAIGLAALKEAQQMTLQTRDDFVKWQTERRNMQTGVRQIQDRLIEIHLEMDKTSRGEDKYLNLLTEEHMIIKKEKQFMDEFDHIESTEAKRFDELSAQLDRNIQLEQERLEKVRYLAIKGAIVGAVFGIVGTALYYRLFGGGRSTPVQPTQASADSGDTTASAQIVDSKRLAAPLIEFINDQNNLISLFLKDVKSLFSRDQKQLQLKDPPPCPSMPKSSPSNDGVLATILAALQAQNTKLRTELLELRGYVAAQLGYQQATNRKEDNDKNTVVYFVYNPSDSSPLPEDQQHKITVIEDKTEYQRKIDTVVAVVLLYSALVLVVPLVSSIFSK